MTQQLSSNTPLPARNAFATSALSVGSVVFLTGTVIHPARDGHGIAAVGKLYAITHAVQAIGLALIVLGLVGVVARLSSVPGSAVRTWYTALAGTLAWFGLIVYDGSHNPVAAAHTPDIVHTSADLDPGGMLIVLPALVLFPLGYALVALVRPFRWPTILFGAGGVVYAIGGLLLFVLGPHSPVIQITEVAGALPLAVGAVTVARGGRGGA